MFPRKKLEIQKMIRKGFGRLGQFVFWFFHDAQTIVFFSKKVLKWVMTSVVFGFV